MTESDSSAATVHLPFPAGRPMMIAGPTGCGKTCWVFKLLKSKHNFSQPVTEILYCYGVYQPLYNVMKREVPNITFHKGLPNSKTIKQFAVGRQFKIVVLDDLMEKVIDNLDAQQMFTKFCHHYNFSTLFLTQNIFAAGKCARNISLNTLILVLFQNHRDRSQIWTVGRQLCPTSPSHFVQVFEEATTCHDFGYLVVDCTPQCKEEHRWRTDIFKDENAVGTCFIHHKRRAHTIPLVVSTSSSDTKKAGSKRKAHSSSRRQTKQSKPSK